MVDYYKALNVSRKASFEDIKKSYKSMAIKYHPDKNPDNLLAETIFKNLAIAYGILSNPEKRMEYDKKTSFSNTYDKYSSIFGKSTTASNFGKQPVRKSVKGEDIYHDIYISISELYQQKKHILDIYRNIKCGHCDGTGIKTLKKCHKCVLVIDSECKTCFGSGLIPDILCEKCKSGLVTIKSNIEIIVPIDIKFADTYIISGKGHSGKNGGTSGDFIVRVFEKCDNNNRLSKIGNDIHYLLDVDITDLVLGNDVYIELFDKTITLNIPKGTQLTTKFNHDDIIFDLNLIVPNIISDDEKALYEKLKEISFNMGL